MWTGLLVEWIVDAASKAACDVALPSKALLAIVLS
jgi:hypothetical protein